MRASFWRNLIVCDSARVRRALLGCAVAFALGWLGCSSDDSLPNPGDSVGTGGAVGGSRTSGAGGSLGGGGSGGDRGGSGEDAASSSDAAEDALTDRAGGGATDASLPNDGRSLDTGNDPGDGMPGGATLDGRPWIHLCPDNYTHEQCCAFLCSCLVTVCADSPQDTTYIASCMTNCPKLTDMLLRCRVYHCYESLNPKFPQDHDSHCGHASGRVGGGGCPTDVYQ